MTKNGPIDTAASVRARLRNRADELGLTFNEALQYYTMERFLFRLSQTGWADALVVKGAVMLRVWDGAVSRPTRDIDFFGRVDSSPDNIRAIIRECLEVEVDDGIEFSPVISVAPIIAEARYPGARVRLTGALSGARLGLQLDVGVADAVIPPPGWVDYPTLLDMSAPRILAYHPATAVAEKFQAMVEKGLLNSRVKDYYDVWMLAGAVDFDGVDLSAALRATFARRGTQIPAIRPAVLTIEYAAQAATRTQWSAFVRGLGSAGVQAPDDLAEVLDRVAEFLMPAAGAAAAGESFNRTWIPSQGWR